MTWYRLTRDIELTYNFYGRDHWVEKVTYKKGSYIPSLERELYSSEADYNEVISIPEDAVEKVDFDPCESVHFDEQGNVYFADWGEWKEDLQKYEFEDNPIRTEDRVYFD